MILLYNYFFFVNKRGFTANLARYRKMMIIGYLTPTIIVLLAMITDYSAPEDAKFRPRIGEGSCFFGGIENHMRIF